MPERIHKQESLQLFEDQPIRTAWDETEEEWYFSVVDVIGVLTEQKSARSASTYWAVMKNRLKKEGADQLLTNCKQLRLKASDGVAQRGGQIAGDARRAIEAGTGQSVITDKTAMQLNHVVSQMIEASAVVSLSDGNHPDTPSVSSPMPENTDHTD